MNAAGALRTCSDIAPREVCLLCQQSAEKYLKALLIMRGLVVPRTHDLVVLCTLGDIPTTALNARSLEALSQWAVASRYPDDWADATPGDACVALETARAVRAYAVGLASTSESDTT